MLSVTNSRKTRATPSTRNKQSTTAGSVFRRHICLFSFPRVFSPFATTYVTSGCDAGPDLGSFPVAPPPLGSQLSPTWYHCWPRIPTPTAGLVSH